MLGLETPWEPMVKTGIISFGGEVERKYTYKEYNITTGEEETETKSTKASFNSGKKAITIRAFIYNGSSHIAPKTFQNTIENNADKPLEKKILWTSTPIISMLSAGCTIWMKTAN